GPPAAPLRGARTRTPCRESPPSPRRGRARPSRSPRSSGATLLGRRARQAARALVPLTGDEEEGAGLIHGGHPYQRCLRVVTVLLQAHPAARDPVEAVGAVGPGPVRPE